MEYQQAQTEAAMVYEELFVPALFSRLAEIVADTAHIQPGDHVLDVACGTGVLARAAARRAGSESKVMGLDINAGMLSVAARICPEIEWWKGSADDLPFHDSSFHAVVSQFGLMFFPNPQQALREMCRVLRPGGTLVVAVWDALEKNPAYSILDEIYQPHLEDDALASLREPYIYGNRGELTHLFLEAGIPSVAISTHQAMARFPDIRSMVLADIDGWLPRSEAHFQEMEVEAIIREASQALKPFIQIDGTVEFLISAHLAKVAKGVTNSSAPPARSGSGSAIRRA